jgi:lysophospholipase L1-like esterase
MLPAGGGGAGGTIATGGASTGGFGGMNNGGGGALGGAAAGGSAGAAGNAGAPSGGMSGSGGAAAGAGGGAGTGNAYHPCQLTAGASCAVLPLGDSITEGYGSSGGGYRVELFKQAVQNGKSLTFVGSLQIGPDMVANRTFPKHHEGHGGYTIDSGTGQSGISGSITDQAIANYHPDIVLLMIGTNDINGNIDVAAAPTRLGNLIDDITMRAPNALVVVATIIPIANDGTNQKVKTYDDALGGVVNSRASAGKHVVLLDNYAAFSKDPSYRTTLMFDYLHPNDAGYAVLGQSFYGAISALLPPGN